MLIKEYPLEGLRTYDINLLPDERGFFAEAMRQDWKDFVSDEIVQVNMSLTYPGVVRAWHRHVRGQVDYFLVLRGASQVCAYSDTTMQLVEIFASSTRPMLIRMPGFYFHGFRAVADEPTLLIYFTSRLYNYQDPDEERIAWNDPGVKPVEINGSKSDLRVNQSWDWFYPPHK